MTRYKIYLIAWLVLIADQLAKWQAVRALSPWRGVSVVPGYFDLTLVRNTGGAFGILHNSTWSLVVAAFAAIIAIVGYTVRASHPIPRLLGFALALPLGGALGNLIDRVRLGYVVDFLYAHAGKFEWPVFNVADTCICIGVALLAIYFWSRPTDTPRAADVDEPSKTSAVTEKETI